MALGGWRQPVVSIIFFSLLYSNYHTCVFLPVSLSKPLFPTPFLPLLPDILSVFPLHMLSGVSISTPFLYFRSLFQTFNDFPSDRER